MNISAERERKETFKTYRERMKQVSVWTKRKRKGVAEWTSCQLMTMPVLNPETMKPIIHRKSGEPYTYIKKVKVQGTLKYDGATPRQILLMNRKASKQINRVTDEKDKGGFLSKIFGKRK